MDNTNKDGDSSKETFTSTQETSLLVIIMDTNPSQRILKQDPNLLSKCLDSVIAFGNSHLMQKAQNKLAVMSCHSNTTYVLFCSTLHRHHHLRHYSPE